MVEANVMATMRLLYAECRHPAQLADGAAMALLLLAGGP
jgi:hypothetical protein